MLPDLDPHLRQKAEQLLFTNSTFKGVDYLKSPLKRTLDIYAATPSSGMSLPILAVCGAVVFLQDGHWPFVDVGSKNLVTGKHSPLWKLRTMIPKAQALEAQITQGKPLGGVKDKIVDPRITPVGRILRKTGIDELPQLFTVSKGDTSLVGPRIPSITERQLLEGLSSSEEPMKTYLSLLQQGMRYGLTGMYSVLGRTKLSYYDRLWLDCIYGENASFFGDLKIIALTIPNGLNPSRARRLT